MKRGQIVVLCCFGLLSVSVIAGLYALSPLNGEVYRGSFNRSFVSELQRESVLDLEYNSFYIARATKGHIYLGNYTAPIHLLKVNIMLTNPEHIRLDVPIDSVQDSKGFKLSIDSPYFFMFHGASPKILKGNLGEWVARPLLHGAGYYFAEALPIGPSTFALKSYNLGQQGYELAKGDLDSIRFHNELLIKHIDGVFCVDGRLHKVDALNQLVYLHYYRNEFLVLDTTLSLKYRGHTLDTFSHAMIKVAKLEQGTKLMLSSPPLLVNGLSCVYKNSLFVQSSVMARNQSAADFASGAVIDEYDIGTGDYVRGFHIPNYEDHPVSAFQVEGSQFFVLCGEYLLRYGFSG